MSYENTECPCGGTKLTGEMLCGACRMRLDQHPAMMVFNDPNASDASRRHAAIVLLALARKRK